jgi:hypothetical protein
VDIKQLKEEVYKAEGSKEVAYKAIGKTASTVR